MKEIALQDANVNENEIQNLQINFDYDDRIQVYDIDFYKNKSTISKIIKSNKKEQKKGRITQIKIINSIKYYKLL